MKPLRFLLILLLASLCLSCDKDLSESYSSSSYPACYPSFSWETVPLNAHFSKDSGNFTAAEAKQITDMYDFITLEKNQGDSSVGADIESVEDAIMLKTYDPNFKVLLYWNTRNDYGDMWSTGSKIIYNPDNGDNLEGSLNASWAFYDGVQYYNSASNCRHYFDTRLSQMQQWWSSVAIDMIKYNPSLDGIFADGMMSYITSSSTLLTRLDTYFDEDNGSEVYRGGLYTMLTSVMNYYQENKLILGNCLRSQQHVLADSQGREEFKGLEYCHGGMIEHFACPGTGSYTKEYILNDIELMERAAALGKIVVVKGWPRYKWTDTDELDAMSDEEKETMLYEDITFPLACYLLGAGEYCYFSYSWGYRMEHGWMLDYPEFSKPLGEPLESKQKVYPDNDNSYEYTREFEHASVWVDIEQFTATITWR